MGQDSSQMDSTPPADAVLDILGDESSRTIIEALSEPMTANELSEACDIPLSTMYRKLDQLTEASLLVESARIRKNGQHTTVYEPNFGTISITLDEDDELHLDVDRPFEQTTADERLEDLWKTVREGT